MGPLLFGLVIGGVVLFVFVSSWRLLRARDPLAGRLQEIGPGLEDAGSEGAAKAGRRAWPAVTRLLAGFGLGPKLAVALTRADMPLTAAEYALIMAGAAVAGYALGSLRGGLLLGLTMGAVGGFIPYFYVNYRAGRRVRALTEQLPDVLTLLVGALRAGYGFSQAMEMLVRQMPPPASKEFGRVVSAVTLGQPVQQALNDMADRVGSDDLDLVVTAVVVQYEMGGNLAQTLETIGETVRDRIRILREIRVLTAQQRMTGYILAVWPIVVTIALFLINPSYILRLTAPGMIRALPIAAVVLQVLGFLIIRRIVDIEV